MLMPNINILTDHHFEALVESKNEKTRKIISTLGWAAQNNIPFDAAIDAMDTKDIRFARASNEIKRGLSLSRAVEHLRKYLPEYYINALRRAEENGRLHEILPALGNNASIISSLFGYIKSAIFAPVIELCIGLMLLAILLPNVISVTHIINQENKIPEPVIIFSEACIDFFHLIQAYTPFIAGILGAALSLAGYIFLHQIRRGFYLDKTSFLRLPGKQNLLYCLVAFSVGILPMIIMLGLCLHSVNDYITIVDRNYRFERFFYFSLSFFLANMIFYISLIRPGLGHKANNTKILIVAWFWIFPASIIIISTMLFVMNSRGAYSLGFVTGSKPLINEGLRFFSGLSVISSFILAVLIIAHKFSEDSGKPFLVRLPWLGNVAKSAGLMELAMSMNVMISAGDDVIAAAENTLPICYWNWQKKLMNQFISDMKQGIPWADAWERMTPHGTMEQFIIRNAAARENAAAGYKYLCEHLVIKLDRHFTRLAVVTKTLIIFFFCLLLGTTAYFMLWSLFSITTYYCETWNYY